MTKMNWRLLGEGRMTEAIVWRGPRFGKRGAELAAEGAMAAGAGRKMARGEGKSKGREVKGKGDVKGEARTDAKRSGRQNALPGVAAEAALSFLKETKGVVTWSTKELAETLKIGRGEAEAVIALLEAQGYVQRASEGNGWMTTAPGESVSGGTAPRFARESVEQAVAALRERIKQANKDGKSAFRIAGAVAFGDFLRSERARVQAADVGIRLARRGAEESEMRSAADAKAERAFLRGLRGRAAMVQLRDYAEWMGRRVHRKLV